MPTYGYKCTACDHEFERLQKITDEPIRECEKCGAEVRKILYPVGIVFKGSGFHINDYRSKSSVSNGNGKKESEAGSDAIKKVAEKATEKVEAAK